MLINTLRNKYKNLKAMLNTVADTIEENMACDFDDTHTTKIKIKVSDFVDEKFCNAVGQKIEQRAKKYNACVVPEFNLGLNIWVYDNLKIYKNYLSRFLIEIGEAEAYKYLLTNPVIGDDFNEAEQADIVNLLNAVINAAENGEDYVIVHATDDRCVLTAVVEAFDLEMERISMGEYKFYGWAE